MDLKMEVYSPFLELLGLLEVHNSVIWKQKAFGAGSFSVEALITEESKTLLVPENIIWIEGETAGIIEYIQEESGENGPYITVKGRHLTGILDRVILWGPYKLTGLVPQIMYQLVNDCCIHPTRGDTEARIIPNLVLSNAPIGGTSIRSQKTGGTLLEALEELGEAYQVAFGVRFNPAVPQMEFWARPGVNRSIRQSINEPVFYSTELDDVLSSEYSYNSQNWRNVALVAGEGEGSDRTMVTVVGKVEVDTKPPEPPEPPTPVTRYTITLSVDPQGGGVATGGGSKESGKSVTVTATPKSEYIFAGWRENGEIVSENENYTFTVSGNRILVAVFEVKTASRLPDGYTEIEYIESTTKQYINIPVKNSTTLTVEMDIDILSLLSSGSVVFFGNYYANGSDIRYFRVSQSATKINFGYGAKLYSTTNEPSVGRHKICLDAYNLKAQYDDESVTMTEVKYSNQLPPNSNIPLFCGVSGSTRGNYANIRLYSCKIFDNEILVFNAVPCTNPDGAPGLYDLVEEKFYKSGITTPFAAGPAV